MRIDINNNTYRYVPFPINLKKYIYFNSFQANKIVCSADIMVIDNINKLKNQE